MQTEIDISRIPKRTLFSGEEIPCMGLGTFGSDKYGPEEIAEAARKIAAISPNFVIKVPCIPGGAAAACVLEKEGIRTNLTLVFSPSQAILAGRAGCLFVSPFIGWKEDNGEDCRQYMQDIVTIYKNYGWYGKTQIIAAAVRSPKQIVDCAVSGVDIVTAGLPVFQAAVNHAYTRQGMDTFTDAWDHTAQE